MVDRNSKIEDWFSTYGNDVYNFLVYYTGKSDVEDLVQEVYIKALKNLSRFEERASPKTWLFAIARRTAIDHERKRKMASLLPEKLTLNIPSPDKTPEEFILMKEDLNHLYNIIRRKIRRMTLSFI